MNPFLRRALKQGKKSLKKENQRTIKSKYFYSFLQACWELDAALDCSVWSGQTWVMEEVRISGFPAPHLIARLLSTEKESSSWHHPPNSSMPNACPSPGIPPSPVLPQLAQRIPFTSLWLSLPSPASSPHPAAEQNLCSGRYPASLTKYLFSIYSVLSFYLAKDMSCSPSWAARASNSSQARPARTAQFPHGGSCPLHHRQQQEGGRAEVVLGASALPPAFLIPTAGIIPSSCGEISCQGPWAPARSITDQQREAGGIIAVALTFRNNQSAFPWLFFTILFTGWSPRQ